MSFRCGLPSASALRHGNASVGNGVPSALTQASSEAVRPSSSSGLAADGGGEGLVRQHDLLLQVDHHQALGQGVERRAHVRRNRLGRVEVLQHLAQVEVEDDEADEREERDQLGARVLDDPAASRGAESGAKRSSTWPHFWPADQIGTLICESVE